MEEIAADEEFKATVEDKQIAELRNKLKMHLTLKMFLISYLHLAKTLKVYSLTESQNLNT